MTVYKPAAKSFQVFASFVWPKVSCHMGWVNLTDMTGTSLDCDYGVDATVLDSDARTRNLAIRNQYKTGCHPGRWPYRTHTIRATSRGGGETELHKLTRHVTEGTAGPDYIVHTYINDDTTPWTLAACASVPADVLLDAIMLDLCTRQRVNGENTFLVFGWDDLQRNNYTIEVLA